MSIATTLASLAHAVLVIVKPGVWEAIFGTVAFALSFISPWSSESSTYHVWFSSPLGGVEAAVAIIVSNMSVIIPAILRTLGVGDPFMQEDTVDLTFNTGIEIVRMTSTRIELGLQTSAGTAITDSSMSRGDTSMMTFQKRDLADLDTKDNQRHQLVTQSSNGSLGNSMLMRVEPLVVGSNIADPLAQVRSLPVAKKTQDIMTDVGGGARKNSM